jgi:inosose dehydratase
MDAARQETAGFLSVSAGVRIGVNPLTWSNDDLPALGGETPLETCLAEGKAAGFEGFELGNKFPRDPTVLGPILERHGLVLASGWFSGALLAQPLEAEIESLKPHVHLLKSLGCEALVYAEISASIQGQRTTPLSHRPRLRDDEWRMFGRKLEQLAAYTASEGLKLAYHHHMGTVVETEHEVDRLMDNTRAPVYLLLDTGHMVFAGGDPAAVAARYGSRIAHVHCKDVRLPIMESARNRDTSFIDAVLAGAFAAPGDGCVDYPAVFGQLQEASYRGWLIFEAEQDPVVAPSLATAQRAFQYLERETAAAGLR